MAHFCTIIFLLIILTKMCYYYCYCYPYMLSFASSFCDSMVYFTRLAQDLQTMTEKQDDLEYARLQGLSSDSNPGMNR